MSMVTVLHLCPAGDWAAARKSGVYRADSLDSVGFVHCSDRGTVHLPANRLYAGRDDIVLLEIDVAKLDVPVAWEPPVPDDPRRPEWYPHVYGPIPVEAVLGVHEFPRSADGLFRLPTTLAGAGSGVSCD